MNLGKMEDLYVCMNCGAVATDIENLCNPDTFEALEGCEIPEKIFTEVPVHGGCREMVYVCARCGRESMSDEYICDAETL
jgi:DNA-directed RNA polymerase subunit RPC12/RpoP